MKCAGLAFGRLAMLGALCVLPLSTSRAGITLTKSSSLPRRCQANTNLYDVVYVDTPLREIIRDFGELPDVSIVAAPTNTGAVVTATLLGVRWDDALRRILAAHDLALVRGPDTNLCYHFVWRMPAELQGYPDRLQSQPQIVSTRTERGGVGWLLLGLYLLNNLSFAMTVRRDALRMRRTGSSFGSVGCWTVAVMIWGVLALAVYWLTHRAGGAARDTLPGNPGQ
jgi:hypothetical protein